MGDGDGGGVYCTRELDILFDRDGIHVLWDGCRWMFGDEVSEKRHDVRAGSVLRVLIQSTAAQGAYLYDSFSTPLPWPNLYQV